MAPPALLSPFIAFFLWLLLIYLRSKNSTTTFFDIFIVMVSIGLYALFQMVFYYCQGSSLSDTVANGVINSFISMDPTNKVGEYLRDKVLKMTSTAYSDIKSKIAQENATLTWRTPTGSLLYMITSMCLAAISITYHIFGEKRHTVSRLAELAILASLFMVFGVEIYLYLGVYTRFAFVHNTEIVKLGLAELKKSMSRNLIAFWNDDKNQDMRDHLRKKAEISDGVNVLVKRLQTSLEETTAISSIHGNWSKDITVRLEGSLNGLEQSLRDTSIELSQLVENPSKPGAMLSSQPGQRNNLTTLNSLSTSVAAIAKTKTGTPDVDILLESISQECQTLIADLSAFSKTDLFGSYRNTRDTLVELSRECTIDDTEGMYEGTGYLKRLSCNLNILVVVATAVFLICIAWSKLMLQHNYRVDFCYAIVTCIGLLAFQPYFIDYANRYKTSVGDFQTTLYSALHP